MFSMRKKPKVTNIHTVAQSRIFNLESMDVEFSNGATQNSDQETGYATLSIGYSF